MAYYFKLTPVKFYIIFIELEELSHEESIEEVVQSEFGTEEIEIETITTEEVITESKTKTSLPPLQPLTIASKPIKNVPIAIKPVTTQQLLLLQGISKINFVFLIITYFT